MPCMFESRGKSITTKTSRALKRQDFRRRHRMPPRSAHQFLPATWSAEAAVCPVEPTRRGIMWQPSQRLEAVSWCPMVLDQCSAWRQRQIWVSILRHSIFFIGRMRCRRRQRSPALCQVDWPLSLPWPRVSLEHPLVILVNSEMRNHHCTLSPYANCIDRNSCFPLWTLCDDSVRFHRANTFRWPPGLVEVNRKVIYY